MDNPSTLHADPNILRLALENDEANVNSEERIYELVVRWVNYSYPLNINSSSTEDSSNVQVDDLPSSSSTSKSALMSSELPEKSEDTVNNIQFIEGDVENLENLHEINNEEDIQNNYSNKFLKPWCGDRLAALPSLLKCIRFPVMRKQYIFEKVEGNSTIMAADGMKDLVRNI